MQPLAAAALTAVLTLGGVQVQVSGPTAVMPMPPDAAHMDVVWPTSQVAMYTSVLMSDNSRWSVKTTRRTTAGDIQVSLKPPTSNTLTIITVPKADLEVPIWWVGEVMPEPTVDDPADVPGDIPPPPVTEPPTLEGLPTGPPEGP